MLPIHFYDGLQKYIYTARGGEIPWFPASWRWPARGRLAKQKLEEKRMRCALPTPPPPLFPPIPRVGSSHTLSCVHLTIPWHTFWWPSIRYLNLSYRTDSFGIVKKKYIYKSSHYYLTPSTSTILLKSINLPHNIPRNAITYVTTQQYLTSNTALPKKTIQNSVVPPSHSHSYLTNQSVFPCPPPSQHSSTKTNVIQHLTTPFNKTTLLSFTAVTNVAGW